MASYNSVTFVGNAGRDPEMTYVGERGVACTKFTIALNEYHGKDAQGQAKESTMWLTVVCWDKLAERVNETLTKGQQVLVAGRLSLRTYTDKANIVRQAVEVIASDVRQLGSRPTAPAATPPSKEQDYSAPF